MSPAVVTPSQAAQLAEYGFHVGPGYGINELGQCRCHLGSKCESAGKHPRDNNWQRLVSNDAEEVWCDWAGNGRCNIFGATGHLCDALDIDTPDLERWKQETGFTDIPVTWHQRTGSGNNQLFFQAAPGVGNHVKVRGLPFTDTRGLGGLVILPPSRNANGVYTWEVAPWDCELAPWPPALLAAVMPPPRPVRSFKPKPEGVTRTAPAWLHRIADEGATEGERNSKLFWLCCRCRALGLDENDALQVLWRFGQNCAPRMDEREISRTWCSSARHQGYEPTRQLAPAVQRPSAIMDAPTRRATVVLGSAS